MACLAIWRRASFPNGHSPISRWLDENGCYVNDQWISLGRFTEAGSKSRFIRLTTDERLEYTNRLFDLLAQLVPVGIEGSVSTVPCSFKEFIRTEEQVRRMRANLWRCVEHIARLSGQSGKQLHLGLEPEPLCYLETSAETVQFFEELRADRPKDNRLDQCLGVNYDTCHLAVEFEEPGDVIARFQRHGIKISKLHFSSALKVRPNPDVRRALQAFADDVISPGRPFSEGAITRFKTSTSPSTNLNLNLRRVAHPLPHPSA